jgi:hypothetical protein
VPSQGFGRRLVRLCPPHLRCGRGLEVIAGCVCPRPTRDHRTCRRSPAPLRRRRGTSRRFARRSRRRRRSAPALPGGPAAHHRASLQQCPGTRKADDCAVERDPTLGGRREHLPLRADGSVLQPVLTDRVYSAATRKPTPAANVTASKPLGPRLADQPPVRISSLSSGRATRRPRHPISKAIRACSVKTIGASCPYRPGNCCCALATSRVPIWTVPCGRMPTSLILMPRDCQ